MRRYITSPQVTVVEEAFTHNPRSNHNRIGFIDSSQIHSHLVPGRIVNTLGGTTAQIPHNFMTAG